MLMNDIANIQNFSTYKISKNGISFIWYCTKKNIGKEKNTICAQWSAYYLFENLFSLIDKNFLD